MEIENNEIRNYYEDELQMFRTGDRQPRKMQTKQNGRLTHIIGSDMQTLTLAIR